MRLTAILLIIAFLQVQAKSYPQITLSLKNVSVEKVFYEIERQAGYGFLYTKAMLAGLPNVTIKVKNVSVNEVLNECFKDQPMAYTIEDRMIVVTKRGFTNPKLDVVPEPAPPVEIRGRVMGSGGEPLSNVSVMVAGTSVGTTTDIDGHFVLTAPDDKNVVLEFSSIGYQSQRVSVGNRTEVQVVLELTVSDLSDVVVVGYGTKRKVNLTGSVATVTSDELEKRTVTKSSLALQGQMSGISVRQGSGNPGSNQASLLIRGQGTFSGAGTSPLVLVDGIESSLDNVDPADISSISVLKDAASAAIFGSKAANGVILVETKSGVAGKPIISYSSYVAKDRPTFIPEMINSWEYAEVINSINPGTYSEEAIQKYKAGNDPNYPNFDHIKYLFESGKGIETKQNVSVSGGAPAARYLFSFGYFNNQAIITKNNSERFDLRLNLDSKISEKLRFNVKLAGLIDKNKEPASGVSGLALGAMRNANLIPGPTPDGFWGRNETLHPEADLNSKSFVKNQSYSFYSNGQLIWDITNELKITGQAGYTLGNSQNLNFRAKYPVTPTYGVTLNTLTDSWSQGNSLTLRALIDYDKHLGNHSFHLLGGIERISNESKSVSAYRDGFPNNEIYVIDAGATVRGRQNGSAAKNTLASYFGRLNYNFRERYLFEANLRYDGSSRFPEGRRWGAFPSFSAGWRISQEDFFQNAVPWMNELKVRGSWGLLGNQSIGNYPYQNLLSLGLDYPYGNQMAAGAAITTVPNKEITWESTAITDIGVDISFLNNSLALTIDYFDKITHDILYNVSASSILGATPSSTNAGKVENRGWDFNVSYRNSAGEFTYGASAIFSVVHNKVLALANVREDISKGLFVGYPIGSAYGYVSDGLFANDQEVANYAAQPFSTLATAGGIKLLDLSGPDGKPDGVVNSTYDRRVIGMPLPTTTYALTLNAGYKNFDFFAMLQGEGGRKSPVILGQFFYPLENNSNVQRIMYENSWTVNDPNPKAEFPKIIPTPSGFYNANPISFWYRDATFLRLKSLQVGYSLSDQLLSRTFLKKVRIYISGENLATITGYYKGWDPEMATNGSINFYPLLKVYAAGIDIRF